jgi:hypothetical protein
MCVPGLRPGSSQPPSSASASVGVGDALVAQGERNRAERLWKHDRAARERDDGLAAVSRRDAAGAQLRDPGERLGVEQQHAAGEPLA